MVKNSLEDCLVLFSTPAQGKLLSRIACRPCRETVKALGEDISNLLFCLYRHHLNISHKYFYSYVVIVNFYVLGPCVEYWFFRQTDRR